MILIIQLFLAHILGDFFFQPDKWIKDKEAKKWASRYLYLHVAIQGVLVLVITGDIHLWKAALIITISHYLIDLAKLTYQREKTKNTWFIIDQLLHLLVITAVWMNQEGHVLDVSFISNRKVLLIGTAVLLLINPASVIIKLIISKWIPLVKSGDLQDDARGGESMQDAGKLIGILERVMVLAFILIGKWEGVGFLLAAKSVFRFGDLKDSKDRKLTEYILIGTLLSFGMAMLVGLLTSHFLGDRSPFSIRHFLDSCWS